MLRNIKKSAYILLIKAENKSNFLMVNIWSFFFIPDHALTPNTGNNWLRPLISNASINRMQNYLRIFLAYSEIKF